MDEDGASVRACEERGRQSRSIDVRDLWEPAHRCLQPDVAADLALASTTPAWWRRLRRLIEAERAANARLRERWAAEDERRLGQGGDRTDNEDGGPP